jgi:signal transduction histidine kinase
MIELAQIVTGWPLAATLAAVAATQSLRAGRRRSALNEALHELRRPLQAIALAGGGSSGAPPVLESSVRLAAAALERLDHEVNGGGLQRPPEEVELRSLLEAAVRRWRARANLSGASVSLRWRAGRAVVVGDRAELAQALDNLIVNAIEHGGPEISVDVRPYRGGRVRIVIADSGRAARPATRRDTPAEVISRLSGRRRRGHGLNVVRQVAAAHDGRFALRRSERGSLALLELPLVGDHGSLVA